MAKVVLCVYRKDIFFYPNTFFGSRCLFQTINLDLSIKHINGSSIKSVPNETEFI